MINYLKKLLYLFILFLIINFIFVFNNVYAHSYINIKNVTHGFSGSVWNGSKIVNTYNSDDTPSYKGYTSVGNNVMFKIYFDSSAMINYNKYDIENLTQTRWLYSMQFCSTIPVPNNYTIAYSGEGDVITTYPVITGGSCNLGGNLIGTLYTYNTVVQYTNPSTGTIYMNGHIVIDFNNGNTTQAGSYAVINWNVAEFTEELKNQYEQIIQNNQVINQNNTIINQNNQTNQNLNNIDNSINNSSVDNPSGKFNEFENFLPENGVITQLITLPISLFQKVLNSVNGSCSEYNLGNLLGTNLTLPCIDIINYVGSTIWNVIDILFSGFFVLTISKKMIKTFNSFSSMEEGDVLD